MGVSYQKRSIVLFGILVAGLALLMSERLMAQSSVCSVVRIQIQQELTMERQAFDAHMRITNGLELTPLNDVEINVWFQDGLGNPVQASSNPDHPSALFFITLDQATGISGEPDGNATIAAGAQADINWLIIPAPGAGGETGFGELYQVGATLSYRFGNQHETVDVAPDFIRVQPMPLLTLDYFLPEEVVGEDPSAPGQQQPIPFPLGLRISNSGLGAARSLAIESAQPEIIENNQGLLVNFELLDTRVNDGPVSNSLLATFGDLEPGESATAIWSMLVSLYGSFVSFEADYYHSDTLGGSLTSLIESVNTHSLIGLVRNDMQGRDQRRDFLTRDGISLTLYESEGINTPVADLTSQSSLTLIEATAEQHIYRWTFPATTGAVYGWVLDPGAGQGQISAVWRSDGKLIDPINYWRMPTKPDQQWIDQLHLFDTNSTGDYQLIFLLDDPGVPLPDPTMIVLAEEPLVTTAQGGEAEFTVALSRAPTAEVSIPVASSDATLGLVDPALLVFTPADWSLPQLVRVIGVDTGPDAGNLGYQILLGPSESADLPFSGLQHPPLQAINQGSPPQNDVGLLIGLTNLPAMAADAARGGADPIVVEFAESFSEPPVVIVMPGNEGADPRSVRIRNVTETGFELLPVSAPPGDGSGPPMTVHYLAAMPGDYRLPIVGEEDGPRVQVGRWETTSIQYNPEAFPPNVLPEDNIGNPGAACVQTPVPGWDAQSFPGAAFDEPPILLASLQTWNNEGANLAAQLEGSSAPFMNVALQAISAAGFDGAIELSEVRRNVPCDGLANTETIGFVAIENNVDVLLRPSGGGAPITLVTGLGVAHRGEANDPPVWSPDHCRANDLTVSGDFVEANLRGFAALRSRAEADGGWLRRCSVSAPSAAIQRLGLRIDEDNHFDAERRQTPVPASLAQIRSEPVSIAIFGGDFITTPVSLAWMKVERLASDQVRVEWATETEVGHVGFEIQARGPDGWQTTGDLIPGRAFGELGGDEYSIVLSIPAESLALRLVDIDQYGHRRLHPPVAIGGERGARPEIQLTDWASIHARNAQYPIRAREAPDGVTAVARVNEVGIQRLSHAELLAAGVDLSGQPAVSVAVWTGGIAQARHVGGPTIWGEGSYVEWLGEPSESRYHSDRAYRIGIDPASAIAVPDGAPASPGTGPRIERHAIRFERNLRYSPSSPADDPWFDARLTATGNPVQIERHFELGPHAPGSVSMAVDVWGGISYPGEDPDHHVELWLNGTLIANHRFDGIVAERIQVELQESWLAADNTLVIRLPGDTGFPADVVEFDGFTLTLPRFSAFHDGRGAGADPLSGHGDLVFHSRFESKQTGFLVEQAPAGSVLWYETPASGLARLVHESGALWLPEDTRAWAGVAPDQFIVPMVEAAVAPAGLDVADYLIISHPQFVDHLGPLINLQQARGLTVAVVRTDEIYSGFGHDEPVPDAIGAFIAAQATARFVLLVGGDHVDYRGYLDNGAQSFIPTYYRQADAIVRHSPDELRFVDRNGDGQPDAALGRLPVRSVDELHRLIAAIVERDQAGPAERQLIASGGSGSPHERFGHDARVLGSINHHSLPTAYAAVDELGTSTARQRLRDGLAGEADWLSYLGHSAPDRWGFEPLLRRSQLPGILRTEAPAIVSQWGCWNNWFVSPTQDAMVHGLMLADQVKASAVIGAVTLAEDASHFALATRFYSLRAHGGLYGQPGPVVTLGEALMHAQRDLIKQEPAHRGAARSVVLFGDPAQPLRHP